MSSETDGEAAQPPPPDPRLTPVTMPWPRDEELVANCAIGHLRDNLQILVGRGGPVHAETLLAAIGAIAGFSALHFEWETMVKPGYAKLTKEITVVKGVDGLTYYVADLVLRHLVPQDRTMMLWALVSAAAVDLGKSAESLPSVRELYRGVLATVGRPTFGTFSGETTHRPGLTVRQLLAIYWAPATKIFSWVDVPLGPQYASPRSPTAAWLSRILGRKTAARMEKDSLKLVYWPVVAAIVAQKLIYLTKDVLDPAIGVKIVMESALSASLVDPARIPTKTVYRFGKYNT